MKVYFKQFLLVVISLIIGVMGYFGYIYVTITDNPFNNRNFDRNVWVSFHNDMNPDNPRGEMYEDLVDSHLHMGMKKEEIIKLLGYPDIEQSKTMLSYNLGMWSGFRIDYDSLDIKLSHKGTLVDVLRVQH